MANVPVSELVRRACAGEALLGSTRLVLIDGPAGSGKTTLATRLCERLGGAPSHGPGTFDPRFPADADAPAQLLHSDDMYEGWAGLDALDTVLVDQVLAPLTAGAPGAFRMWDWHRSERTHHIEVPPRPFLIVEGVGVARAGARELATLSVWVEAPAGLRLERGLARDGSAMAQEWRRWQAVEAAHFAADDTRRHADVVVDGAQQVPS